MDDRTLRKQILRLAFRSPASRRDLLNLLTHTKRHMQAFSKEIAKQILGFPITTTPSASEIHSAWRSQVQLNHPDHGGSPEKMKDINLARDILDGHPRLEQTPLSAQWDFVNVPKPPVVKKPPQGTTISFDTAKLNAQVPQAVWRFVTDGIITGYSSDEFTKQQMGWVVYGSTTTHHVFVGVEHKVSEEHFVDGEDPIDMWDMNVTTFPATLPLSNILTTALSNVIRNFKFVKGKRFNGKVHAVNSAVFTNALVSWGAGKSMPLKTWLVQNGELKATDPAVVNRKHTVTLLFTDDLSDFDYLTRGVVTIDIDGIAYPLSKEDRLKFGKIRGLTMVFGTYYYGGSSKVLNKAKNGKVVMQWLIKNTTLPQEAKDSLQATLDQLVTK